MTTDREAGPARPERALRTLSADEIYDEAAALLGDGFRLGLAAAHDDGPLLRIVYLFLAARPERRVELQLEVPAGDPQIPSLAGLSFPAGRFEREMHDLYGVVPVGHPLPRRLVRHAHWPAGWHPMRHEAGPPPPFAADDTYPFLRVEGAGVYEIPVGPVHAGLIEPGHFRITAVGETILKLKARLWFTHRGVEKLFEGQPALGAVALAERISGDTAAAHGLAHCLAVEDALGIEMSPEGQRLRVVLVELERLYNHIADLGAMANDVGFGLANAHAQRIREQLLRINRDVTGHRLLRDGIQPAGVHLVALPDIRQLRAVADDVAEVADLTLAHSMVRERFVGTAPLTATQASELGCLGYVARASGLVADARIDHPVVTVPLRPARADSGDVFARFTIRRDEYAASTDLLCELIEQCDGLTAAAAVPTPTAERRSGVGIVEGWRGTIVHRVELDGDRISRAKVVDPSWFNWPALPVALSDTIVPDFPLVNKSFNLSYAGNDL